MEKQTIEKIKKYPNLLKDYGSPLYIYDHNVLKERCNEMYQFKKMLENKLNGIVVNMHYSPKANGNPAILKVVKETGLFVDCMSPLELEINKKCGFEKDKMMYVCNNIDTEEMQMVHNEGILMCLDSISQVETWGKLFPNTEIMVRINPLLGGVGHSEKVITSGKEAKFGITEENLPKLFNVCEKYNLKIIGVHQHLGSHFLDDEVLEYITGINEGLRIIKEHFKNVQIIDLGGGFGVPYKPTEKKLNLSYVVDELEKILSPFINSVPSVNEIRFEPGRFIPCESSALIGKVNAIKCESGIWWIGTDIGMNELVRPSMYDAYHEVTILENNEVNYINNIETDIVANNSFNKENISITNISINKKDINTINNINNSESNINCDNCNNCNNEEIIANVCGNVCESCDIIASNRKIKIPQIGDIVLVHDTGAYGYSMASNYTGRPRPAEIMLFDDTIKVIRKRETLDYLESNIVW